MRQVRIQLRVGSQLKCYRHHEHVPRAMLRSRPHGVIARAWAESTDADPCCTAQTCVVQFDLVVTGGTVIDGTGAGRYRAEVGIVNGRIQAIARAGAVLNGAQRVDATGKVLGPGFVDSNSHVDWIAPLAGREALLAPMLLQGITTSVGGGCGYSPAPVFPGRASELVDRLSAFLHEGPFRYRWSSFGEFLSALEADRPLVNVGFLVGQNTLRDLVRGMRPGAPTALELKQMKELLAQALHDGALGLSGNAGMRPGRYATADELTELAAVVRQADGVCAVHARAYTALSDSYSPLGAPHNVRAVRELIEVARRSSARVQISHLLFAGRRTWRTTQRVLDEINQARLEGIDIAFDAIPYTVSGGPLELIFPSWFVARFPGSANSRMAALRLKTELAIQRTAIGIGYQDIRLMASAEPGLNAFEGLDVATIADRLGISPVDAELHLARQSRLGAMVLFDTCSGTAEDDQPLRSVLRDQSCAFITNAAVRTHGARNPAAFGAFPRVLGHFSRDLGLFSLEEAVRRATSYPAERVGLKHIGRIAEGYHADLVVFDPETVGHQLTGAQAGDPAGIATVIVSGAVVAADGRLTPGPPRGRVLRRNA